MRIRLSVAPRAKQHPFAVAAFDPLPRCHGKLSAFAPGSGHPNQGLFVHIGEWPDPGPMRDPIRDGLLAALLRDLAVVAPPAG
jgi:hypothetical protein